MKADSILLVGAASLLSTASAKQFVMYNGGDDPIVERADPIINPGQISQHTHQIFGASGFSPELDYDALQKSECTTMSDASGNGVNPDKSVYWHPSMYAEAADGSGYIRIPTMSHKFYYSTSGDAHDGMGGQVKASPFTFPPGFRMIAGNMLLRAPNSDMHLQSVTQWICHSTKGDNKEGPGGGFPTNIGDCDAYPGLNGAIHFPHCWNGQAYNPATPTAHMSYPDGNMQTGPCPASHPTRLPHIFSENQFDQHSVVGKIKPNTYVLAQGDPTGYGWHYDFFNGWAAGAIEELMDTSTQGNFGNEDIADGSVFKTKYMANNKGADCKAKWPAATFRENVDTPGHSLPGCNPIGKTNPAPMSPVAGMNSNACDGAGAAAGSGAQPPASGLSSLPPPSSLPTMASPSSGMSPPPSGMSPSPSGMSPTPSGMSPTPSGMSPPPPMGGHATDAHRDAASSPQSDVSAAQVSSRPTQSLGMPPPSSANRGSYGTLQHDNNDPPQPSPTDAACLDDQSGLVVVTETEVDWVTVTVYV